MQVVVHNSLHKNDEEQRLLERLAATPDRAAFLRQAYAEHGGRVCTLTAGDSFGHECLLTGVARCDARPLQWPVLARILHTPRSATHLTCQCTNLTH